MKDLIAVLFFIGNIRMGAAQIAGANDSLMIWTEGVRLRQTDFCGSIDSSFLVYGHPTPGASSIRIKAFVESVDEKAYLVIFCIFDKQRSWLDEGAADRLNHERGHFDIGELFARRMRRSVSMQPDVPDYLERIFLQIKLINEDLKQFQAEYDAETSHGASEKEQSRWERMILKELSSLRNYSENRVLLKRT